jgi:hypothetical protein
LLVVTESGHGSPIEHAAGRLRYGLCVRDSACYWAVVLIHTNPNVELGSVRFDYTMGYVVY